MDVAKILQMASGFLLRYQSLKIIISRQLENTTSLRVTSRHGVARDCLCLPMFTFCRESRWILLMERAYGVNDCFYFIFTDIN